MSCSLSGRQLVPSRDHQERLAALVTIARLAGLQTEVQLFGGTLFPDVAFADFRRRRLLVGDAKATEGPNDREAIGRLRRYFRALRKPSQDGFDIRIAVCAGSRAVEWRSCLLDLSREASFVVKESGAQQLGDDYVAWVDLSATTPSTGHSMSRAASSTNVGAPRSLDP